MIAIKHNELLEPPLLRGVETKEGKMLLRFKVWSKETSEGLSGARRSEAEADFAAQGAQVWPVCATGPRCWHVGAICLQLGPVP